MDNWPVLVALTLALAGGIFLLSRPLPLDYKNGEYRRHLTATEKAALQRGEVVEKTHQAYQTIWRTYSDRGPLRVTQATDGTCAFAPHGHWQRLTKQGQVWADSYPTARHPAPTWREYLPNGQPDFTMYALRTVVEGGHGGRNPHRAVQIRCSHRHSLRTAFVLHRQPGSTAFLYFVRRNWQTTRA